MDDHTGSLLDLSHASPDIISFVLGSMSLRERFTCALVCKAWAEAATAATHSIILKLRKPDPDLSGLQHWLEKHGNGLEVLQLHGRYITVLTALPCCAKLQDLLVLAVSTTRRTWGDIAAATKLTSISLNYVQTASQQADVVAALTALPNLEQLTWSYVQCSGEQRLTDSLLLQQMTRLTSLDLNDATAAALQHLGSLTKLQHLGVELQHIGPQGWATAGCPGLQELKALTSLQLSSWDLVDMPASVIQMTALRQLDVYKATPTALNQLQVLTGLTQLCVRWSTSLSPESPPLQLPGLQHLEAQGTFRHITMPMSFLASCTQLQFLKLRSWALQGPGSLLASTVLQHLELRACSIAAADGAADPVSWQQLFPGPGQLPHLTSLELFHKEPPLQQADIEAVVVSATNHRSLGLDRLHNSFTPALMRLPGLTSLCLDTLSDEECSAVVQLTGLRQLKAIHPRQVSAVGLRQLTALQQLTTLGCGTFPASKQLQILALHLMKDNLSFRLPDCHFAIINKAPTGSPPDVSSRLLDICDVVDACEGLIVEAVIAAAEREVKPSGSPGDGRAKPLTAEALLAAAAAMKA